MNDQLDLDLVYYQPYVPSAIAPGLFEFLRQELPFYRVQYKITRGGVQTQINTPRFTTVFGVDDTSRFALDGSIVDAKTGKPVEKNEMRTSTIGQSWTGSSRITFSPKMVTSNSLVLMRRLRMFCMGLLRALRSIAATPSCILSILGDQHKGEQRRDGQRREPRHESVQKKSQFVIHDCESQTVVRSPRCETPKHGKRDQTK